MILVALSVSQSTCIVGMYESYKGAPEVEVRSIATVLGFIDAHALREPPGCAPVHFAGVT